MIKNCILCYGYTSRDDRTITKVQRFSSHHPRDRKALLSMPSIGAGLLHLFIKHTSASLSINENADPSVREDMENFFTDIADDKTYYIHTYEGSDDMPAHIKTSMLGNSLTIPITNGRMNLGTWQGIYLGEHRDYGGNRRIVVTLYS